MIEAKTFLTSDGVTISYRIARFNYTKPTLVFVHGFSGNHTGWFPLAHRIEGEHFNTLMYDLRGHGLSSKVRKRHYYSFPRFVQDLEELIARERIVKPILVGYSGGGIMSLMYALAHPDNVDRIILISTNHTNPLRYWRIAPLTGFLRIVLDMIAVFGHGISRRRYLFLDMTTMRSYRQATLMGLRSMPFDVNLWCLRIMGEFDLSNDLRRIANPILILRGHHDYLFSLRECRDMLEKLPHAELKIISRADHFLVTRYPDKIFSLIKKFIGQ